MSDKKVKQIAHCRVSESTNLKSVLNLGNQALTGVFPKSKNEQVTTGPLELVWCKDSGLLQLNHSYDLDEMYGMNYGYRSGLNQSMVRHLTDKVAILERWCPLSRGDTVLDIGSNDATLLNAYKAEGITRVGIDPTGIKFKEFYPDDISLVPEFFNEEAYQRVAQGRKAKIVTSIAMFYDLEDPHKFVGDIANVLDDEGVWNFEQSYLPTMLRMNSYDTACHEHLEYYSLLVVRDILARHDLMILDVQMNDINGGSFAVTAAHRCSKKHPNDVLVQWLLDQEMEMGLHTIDPYLAFQKRVVEHRDQLNDLLSRFKASGKKVIGYGASTKGNVLLQYCGITENELACIAEVNPDKFGAYTPGTKIPIVSEQEARAMKPDYMLVLPWHFRTSIIPREQEYLRSGGKLLFPLPNIEVV